MDIVICSKKNNLTKAVHKAIEKLTRAGSISISMRSYCNEKAIVEAIENLGDIAIVDSDILSFKVCELLRVVCIHNPDLKIVLVIDQVDDSPRIYKMLATHKLPIAQVIYQDNIHEGLLEYLDRVICTYLQKAEVIKLTVNHYQHLIQIRDILFVESIGRKTRFHLNNAETLECYAKLCDIEKVLSNKGFIRVQKSFVVNRRFVSKISRSELIMINGTCIPLSRQLYQSIVNEVLRLEA